MAIQEWTLNGFSLVDLIEPIVDSIASNDSILIMSATITIRNLDEEVIQKLRMRAASNGRSMEAEAREILRVVLDGDVRSTAQKSVDELRARLKGVRGAWRNRGSTDELMKLARGEN